MITKKVTIILGEIKEVEANMVLSCLSKNRIQFTT